MIVYKVCLVNGDGQLALSRRFMCANDHEALALARKVLKNAGHAEVWRGSTLVDHVYAATERADIS